MDLSVVIPTYNGAERLPAVLAHLRDQVAPNDLQWEVIIVDNNSQDETAEIAQQYQASWRSDVSLSYVFEPQQGLAFARQCGVDHATGTLVGFLDDDNWPAVDWVAAAVQFGQEHPQVGAYGGKTEAAFEQPPAMPIKSISKFLALQNYGSEPYRLHPERQILPAGAGLVVRRSAWLACIPRTLVRISQGGDDYEISLRLAKNGWEIYYNPAMQIQHYIPAARLEREYLLRLTHRYGLCTCQLMMLDVPWWQQPFLLTKFSLGTLKRMLQHCFAHGLHQSDLALQCQMSFYQGNFAGICRYVLSALSASRLKAS
ncbi:MAG: glycosyltransferase family 2 protein [Leptolyngbya sp. SIOISBB]|nr:glycosyltransferase family 2 protein [Leptolyngbya sp. SIOISBB]